ATTTQKVNNKHIVIIDINREAADLLVETLQSNFENVQTHVFRTYHTFLKVCQLNVATAEPAVASVSSSEDVSLLNMEAGEVSNTPPLYTDSIAFIIDPLEMEVREIEPAPGANDELLGRPASEYLTDGKLWQNVLSKGSPDDFAEFLQYIGS